jgi:uncharacterized iron-regulated protein
MRLFGKLLSTGVLASAAGIFLLTVTPAFAHILNIAEGDYIPFEEVIADLRQTQMVFVGELHDRESHHAAQLQIIEALQRTGKQVAIGLEMFQAQHQDVLDRWVAGELDEAAFRFEFERNWGMWEMYADILRFARAEGIPLVGLNVPREITQQVAQEGFESLTPEQLEMVPGVRCDVDPEYEAYIRRSLGVHAHGNMDFRNFCEAQMVWDTAMAHNLVNYVQANPEKTVVVVAGSAHAWRYGIPRQVSLEMDAEYRIVLPEIPGRLTAQDVTTDEADYLLLGLDEDATLH